MSCFLCVQELDGNSHKNQEISVEESAYLCSFLGLPNNDEDYRKHFHKFCHVCDSCKNKILEAKRFMQKLEKLELEIRVLRDEFYDSLKQGYFHKLTTNTSLRHDDDFSHSFREKIVQALQLVINVAPESTILIDDEEFSYQIVEVCESSMNDDDDGFQLSNDDQITDLNLNNKGDEEHQNQDGLLKFQQQQPPTSSLSTSFRSKNLPTYFSLTKQEQTISNTIPSKFSTSSSSAPRTVPIKQEEEDNKLQETKFTLVDNDVEIERQKHGIQNDVSIKIERLSADSIIKNCERSVRKSNNRSNLCKKSQTRIKGRLHCLFPNCIVTFRNEIIRRAHIRKFHAYHNKIGSLQKKRKSMKQTSSLLPSNEDGNDDESKDNDPDYNPDSDSDVNVSKPFSCTFKECSANFFTKMRLHSHLRRVHGQTLVGEMVCHVCNKSDFSTRRQLNHHLMYHRPKKYNCTICKKGFVRAPDLRRHEKCHGPRKILTYNPVTSELGIPETPTQSRVQRPKLTCLHDGCGAVYYEKYRLEVHRRKVHLGLKNPYKCRFPDCQAEMKNRPKYDEHIRNVHSFMPKVWKCKICPDYIEFNVRKLYDEHMEDNHPEAERKGNWSCLHCYEKFKTLDLRTIHMNLNHADKKNTSTRGKQQSGGSDDQEIHVCHVCGIKKVGKKKLKDHLKYHGKKHSCPICPDRTFSRLADLKRHSLTHSEERNAICDRCGKSFKDRGYLRVHHRTCSIVERKKFPCTVEGCSSVYSNESSLKVHLREHDGSLQRTHKCDLCEFKAKWASTIMYHRRSHFQTKEFECHICSAKFKQKNSLTLHIDFKHLGKRGKVCTFAGCTYKAADKQSLQDHMRTHTKEKPFVCKTCSRPFSKKCHLYRHERTQHEQTRESLKKPGRPRKEFLSRICIKEGQPHAQEPAEYLIYALKC